MLGERVLRLADKLSYTLQQKSLSAAESNKAAMLTCDILVILRIDNKFDKFWDSVNQKAQEVGINEPVLPRKRWTPVRFEDGHGDPHYPLSAFNLSPITPKRKPLMS